ncbi:MAG: hypothetical protein ABEI52_04395, partial [Halobacteriaceae archaeon]
AADIEAEAFEDRTVSHSELLSAGVNPGIAALLRREHALPWTFDAEGSDLDKRAREVRGLGDAERAWVAASNGEWQGDATAAPRPTRNRVDVPTPDPTPVTVIEGIDESTQETLADGGIISIRSLLSADPKATADALELDADDIRDWQEDALEVIEDGST